MTKRVGNGPTDELQLLFCLMPQLSKNNRGCSTTQLTELALMQMDVRGSNYHCEVFGTNSQLLSQRMDTHV